jgi:hypothetical protein
MERQLAQARGQLGASEMPPMDDDVRHLCLQECLHLFCFVLFCFALFCFVLLCFGLVWFVLFCFVLFCFVLFCDSYLLLESLCHKARSSGVRLSAWGCSSEVCVLVTAVLCVCRRLFVLSFENFCCLFVPFIGYYQVYRKIPRSFRMCNILDKRQQQAGQLWRHAKRFVLPLFVLKPEEISLALLSAKIWEMVAAVVASQCVLRACLSVCRSVCPFLCVIGSDCHVTASEGRSLISVPSSCWAQYGTHFDFCP